MQQMAGDHVVKRYKQKSVTHHVTVSNGLPSRGASVNYRIKTNWKVAVKEKCLEQWSK